MEKLIHITISLSLSVPIDRLADGPWIEREALAALQRGEWEMEEDPGP